MIGILTAGDRAARGNGMDKRFFRYIKSPVGRLFLAGDGVTLTDLRFARGSSAGLKRSGYVETGDLFNEAIKQLESYFRGELKSFDLTLEPEGTAFQKAAWEELRKIPYGETITYGEQARRMGRPKACRAVGGANGRNPISIIIPCHRVVGSGGDLTGFGGGLDIKRKLLTLERENRI